MQKQQSPPNLEGFVPLHGFEPRQAEPESDVLPLHHKGVFGLQIYEKNKNADDGDVFYGTAPRRSHDGLLKNL